MSEGYFASALPWSRGVARSYWMCSGCGQRNERIKQRCQCGRKRPKKRVARHAQTLRDHPYAYYVQVNREIHGVTDESCGVCGKPRSQERHHDRDHDHKTGKPRGLACGGNRGCNVLMLPWITSAVALVIATEVDEPAASRWRLIGAYLERVEAYYESQAVAS